MYSAYRNYLIKMKTKVRINGRCKTSEKCQECGDILGKSRFRSRFSDDAFFCRKDCASKNEIKIKNNMVDNDESEFYI